MTRKFIVAAAALAAMSGGALAADLPTTKGPPEFAPPPPPAFTWTGLYIGGQVGYQWGTTNTSVFSAVTGGTGFLPTYQDSGVAGGAHLGYNLQFNEFVIGIEGDVNGSSYLGSGTSTDPFNAAQNVTETTHIPIEGSIRGRVGFAWDRVLFYGTGGVAFADIRSNLFFTSAATGANVSGFASNATERAGWTAGGGIEYAITNEWSLRAEYRYSDYGSLTYSLATIAGGAGSTATKRITDNLAQVGFSYKFDMFAPPAPVVAKY